MPNEPVNIRPVAAGVADRENELREQRPLVMAEDNENEDYKDAIVEE